MVFTILEKALILGIFGHVPVSHAKLQTEFFENLFPPAAERGGENYDLLYQILSENMKISWNIRLFIFCMTCSFSKCDGFIYSFVNNIYHNGVVLSLLPLLCNHDNLILKFNKKIDTLMKCGFL